MTEQPASYEVKKIKGRPKKAVTGKKMWIPADCVEFVESYLEVKKQKSQEEKQKQAED